MRRTCGNCRAFATAPDHCRLLPPRALAPEQSAFPIVNRTHVCRQHRYSAGRLFTALAEWLRGPVVHPYEGALGTVPL